MSVSLLNRHKILKTIPPLAQYKALLLEYGVDADRDFFYLPHFDGIKTKYRIKRHQVKNGKLIDASNDPSVIPSELILEFDGKKTLSRVAYRHKSPLKLMSKEDELFLLDTISGQPLDVNVQSVERKGYSDMKIPEGRLAAKGTRLEDYVQLIGMDRIGILAYSGCIHWLDGQMCKFCDENPKRPGEFKGMASLNNLVDFDWNVREWWKFVRPKYTDGIAYAFETLLNNEKIEPHTHLQLMAGNLRDADYEWEICMNIGDVLNSIRPISIFDSYLNLIPPNRSSYLKQAKEIGFKNISFNLEVIGTERFNEVCPGKAKTFGYEGMVDSLKESVKIFGKGHVRSNFVLGAQPVEELLSGIKDLASYGIVADYSVFIPKKHTPWAKKPSPSLDTIVYFTKELVEIYEKNGFEGIYCGLSSRSNIIHEVIDK